MRLHTFLLLAVLALLAAAPVAAEESPAPALGSLTLVSSPPGCGVRLLGDQVIEGRTPLTLARGLAGRYRVLGLQDGYETWRRTVVLDGVSTDSLYMQLTPKTALRAGARSLLFPGWGQFYSGRPGRGWLMTLLGLGGAAAAIVGEVRYADKVDQYDAARDRYRAARSVDEVEAAYAAYRAASQDAEDAWDRRQWLMGAGIAAWSLNLLDAVLLFEGPSRGSWRVTALYHGVPGDGGAPALALRGSF
jgi:hypothetical protein